MTTFCLTDYPIKKTHIAKLEAIAAEHGVTYVFCGDRRVSPASGWFAGPDLGEPFDSARSRNVRASIVRDGLTAVLRP